jgi:nicotinate-nucleotide pyrophosphorylase (carboxylating)
MRSSNASRPRIPPSIPARNKRSILSDDILARFRAAGFSVVNSSSPALLIDPCNPDVVRRDVQRALEEDIGTGDATAELLPPTTIANARVITREDAVVAGRAWFDASFKMLDASVAIAWNFDDGARAHRNDVLCTLRGPARTLVSGERCALNFLQALSGTATTTARYVDAVRGTRATILDTRKTLPGLRIAQKYAVRCGGGTNHRIGLFDAMLIKENHIAAAGSLADAVRNARERHPELLLEVEVENLDELRDALAVGVDRVMLDEFSIDDIRRAVAEVAGRTQIEVSGGVSLEALPALAATGVDFISIGTLTKHVRAIDLSMRIVLDR